MRAKDAVDGCGRRWSLLVEGKGKESNFIKPAVAMRELLYLVSRLPYRIKRHVEPTWKRFLAESSFFSFSKFF